MASSIPNSTGSTPIGTTPTGTVPAFATLPRRLRARPESVPLLVFASGVLRATAAFLGAVAATVISAPLQADPQHHLPRSLTRARSD
ncbi:hypothetical protein [uncultured Amnibacterium sp.]|uniref:hypothetical protein n=1 Tax=uncultured Amnibacterium sp. TaxID=1631851 RepID=UPI0035CC3EDB